MKIFIIDLVKSLKVEQGGFSARKLSALLAIIIAGYITLKNCNDKNVVELSIVWLCFGGVCLSIVTIDQIITLRTGVAKPNKNESA